MPFIPHTSADTETMLTTIGVKTLDALFDEIPPALKSPELGELPAGLSELEVTRLMRERAAANSLPLSFVGAGAYEHHVPAAVWEIATRGELYSAYTPYQAEASQGTLQIIYEYQSMMASLTELDISNASLYDGATALAEAMLMAVRHQRRSQAKKILVPRALHPFYRQVAEAITRNQGLTLVELPYDPASGRVDLDALAAHAGEDLTALVVCQPNFFGVLEDVDALTDWAADHKALTIGVVNPTGLAVLKPPGQWGRAGAEIACGEGQPLGIPLSGGGPYFGFLCCREALVRQLPGRLVGRTLDLDGRVGYTLTLQAREQHIRRSRATSNICTNQGLMVAAATIYMSLLGPTGLGEVASTCHRQTSRLAKALRAIPGVEPLFDAPHFHEVALRLPVPVAPALVALAARGVLGGAGLETWFPELGDALLVCATETKTDADIERFASALATVVAEGAA